MTSAEFEKVYAERREPAIRHAMSVCHVGRSIAEDGVQNAALYCLERLDRFDRITDSYFTQLVVNNTKMCLRSENARAANREHGVGDWNDVVKTESIDARNRTGRTVPVWDPFGTSVPPPTDLESRSPHCTGEETTNGS